MTKISYNSHDFHRAWMKFSAVVVLAFGPIFLLGAYQPTAELTRFMMDIFGWTFWNGQSFDAPTTRFVSALAGGFLVGWGIVIWQLAANTYDIAPEPVRKAVLIGYIGWYITDSVASVASGHPSNAGFNTFFLLVLVGPMWRRAAPDDRTNNEPSEDQSDAIS